MAEARRQVAFLRGVSPVNARMADLRRCFEHAGFTDVRTVRSSGNVVFAARARSERALARTIEAAMREHLDRVFPAIVRSTGDLQELLAADPFSAFRLPANAKRVVTFLREPPAARPRLPVADGGARILATNGREAFTVYVPDPRGPVFMSLIARTFGDQVTTRTWDTVRRCAGA